MKRYIIRTGEGDAFNAASKARQDADAIALRRGYEPFPFKGKRTADHSITAAVSLAITGYQNWKDLIKTTRTGDIVLVQYPHYPMKSAYLAKHMMQRAQRKGIRFVALIHDLDSLRGYHGKAAVYSDTRVLPLFDAIICHNERMKEHLIKQSIPEDKLISLGIFDYLTDAPFPQPGEGIAVAGNLDPEKSGYIKKLIETAAFPLRLYGKGLKDEDLKTLPSHVHYHGSFPPAELPGKLEGQYGLVWDGPEITACAGKQGEYLKYNNPHKLSLYLAAGLPVILWSGAAEADFVRETNTGILTDSLDSIPFPDNYDEMKQNTRTVAETLRAGHYLTKALEKAEQTIVKRKDKTNGL